MHAAAASNGFLPTSDANTSSGRAEIGSILGSLFIVSVTGCLAASFCSQCSLIFQTIENSSRALSNGLSAHSANHSAPPLWPTTRHSAPVEG